MFVCASEVGTKYRAIKETWLAERVVWCVMLWCGVSAPTEACCSQLCSRHVFAVGLASCGGCVVDAQVLPRTVAV